MAGKGKAILGALETLTDVFKKGSDEPADPSRRALLKAAPAAAVGGAGALAGIGGAAILGAKALFGQGRFDKIISEIKPAIDEFYESGDWEGLGKNLDLTSHEIDYVLKHDTFAGEHLDDTIKRLPELMSRYHSPHHNAPFILSPEAAADFNKLAPPGSREFFSKKLEGFDVPGSAAERAFLREQWESIYKFDEIKDPSAMFYRDLGAPLFKHMAKKLESDLLDDKELIELSEILF